MFPTPKRRKAPPTFAPREASSASQLVPGSMAILSSPSLAKGPRHFCGIIPDRRDQLKTFQSAGQTQEFPYPVFAV